MLIGPVPTAFQVRAPSGIMDGARFLSSSHPMPKVLLALAGVALIATVPAQAANHGRTPTAKRSPAKSVSKRAPAPEVEIVPSPSARRVADWVAASGDNRALPYAIVDKQAASLFLFDADGTPLGAAPVLVGIAIGDEASPGVGAKKLAEIGPAEKTTPAGRFLAKFGLAAGRQKVLWVDYTDSVALHAIPTDASPKERRRQRMASANPSDHRITFGCINLPPAFYTGKIQPLFRNKGGYIYVLPDTKPLEAVFPLLLAQTTVRAAPSESGAAAR
jgi:hypothetical protein